MKERNALLSGTCPLMAILNSHCNSVKARIMMMLHCAIGNLSYHCNSVKARITCCTFPTPLQLMSLSKCTTECATAITVLEQFLRQLQLVLPHRKLTYCANAAVLELISDTASACSTPLKVVNLLC